MACFACLTEYELVHEGAEITSSLVSCDGQASRVYDRQPVVSVLPTAARRSCMTGVQLRPHHERKLRELLFTFDFGTDHYRCELRDHGNLGVSGQLITNGESIRSCGF